MPRWYAQSFQKTNVAYPRGRFPKWSSWLPPCCHCGNPLATQVPYTPTTGWGGVACKEARAAKQALLLLNSMEVMAGRQLPPVANQTIRIYFIGSAPIANARAT